MKMFHVEIAGSRYDVGIKAGSVGPREDGSAYVTGTFRAVLIPSGEDSVMAVAEIDDVLTIPATSMQMRHDEWNPGNLGATILLNLAFGGPFIVTWGQVRAMPSAVRPVCVRIGLEIRSQVLGKKEITE